ncbi:MAG: hypothetical protein WKF77_23990 [Planctomycetaceae bacterium]
MNNAKLFPSSEKRRQAERQQQRAKDLLNQIDRLAKNPTEQTLPQIEAKARELTRAVGSGSGFAREMIRSVRDLAKSVSERPAGAIGSFLRSLGVEGNSIARWFRSYEGQQLLEPIRQQVQQAIGLANQLDPDSIGMGNQTPEQAGGRLIPTQDETQRNRILPPAYSNAEPVDDSPHRNVTVLPSGQWRVRGPGFERTYDPNHPAMSGIMTSVNSSNVHSVGFEFNFNYPLKSKLIIRYLQDNRRGVGKVPGPTYSYDNCHPDLFNDLLAVGSKGKWVWDELRIRGTIAGHQFTYNLIRAAQSYLPRRATVRHGQQILRRRQREAAFSTGRETLTSALPNRNVGQYRPTAHRPNVGNPDRGRPNTRR